MNVLEEFQYGNLDPAEYDANSGKEYKELVRLISRNEEMLPATMTDEQLEVRLPSGSGIFIAQRTFFRYTNKKHYGGAPYERWKEIYSRCG